MNRPAASPSDASPDTQAALDVALDRVGTALDTVRDRLADVTDRIAAVKSLRQDIAAMEADVRHMKDRRDEAARDADNAATSLEAVEEEQSVQKSRGSILYAALYSVAGLFFIAGDVIMSREIVANALKLRGDVEPWIFAIGLAMLAILLKPAYDRLVESRYWDGAERAFAAVISVCSLGALGTLWILGAFRSTAFVSNAKIQRLTGELMQTSDPAAIQEIQTQIGVLQQSLMESPLGYWAFVLSGVLFALAGAVCLGIGFRHVRDAYHVRYRLYRAHQRLEEERADALDTVERLDDRIPEVQQTLARRGQELDDSPTLETLRETRAALRNREDTLLDEHADIRSRLRQARQRASGTPPSMTPTGDGAPPPEASAMSDRANGTNGSGARPYVALRDVLKRNGS